MVLVVAVERMGTVEVAHTEALAAGGRTTGQTVERSLTAIYLPRQNWARVAEGGAVQVPDRQVADR